MALWTRVVNSNSSSIKSLAQATIHTRPMIITLADDARKQSIASIKRYFREEHDQDFGDLKAALILEFFLKEIAPTIYNGAIADAQTYVRDRLVDLEGVCSVPEFAFWPSASVRRR